MKCAYPRVVMFFLLLLTAFAALLLMSTVNGTHWFVRSNTEDRRGLFRECTVAGCGSIQNESSANVPTKFFAVVATMFCIMIVIALIINLLARMCGEQNRTNPVAVRQRLNLERAESVFYRVCLAASGVLGVLVVILWSAAVEPDNKAGWRYGFDFYLWVVGSFIAFALFVGFFLLPSLLHAVLGHTSAAVEEDDATTYGRVDSANEVAVEVRETRDEDDGAGLGVKTDGTSAGTGSGGAEKAEEDGGEQANGGAEQPDDATQDVGGGPDSADAVESSQSDAEV